LFYSPQKMFHTCADFSKRSTITLTHNWSMLFLDSSTRAYLFVVLHFVRSLYLWWYKFVVVTDYSTFDTLNIHIRFPRLWILITGKCIIALLKKIMFLLIWKIKNIRGIQLLFNNLYRCWLDISFSRCLMWICTVCKKTTSIFPIRKKKGLYIFLYCLCETVVMNTLVDFLFGLLTQIFVKVSITAKTKTHPLLQIYTNYSY